MKKRIQCPVCKGRGRIRNLAFVTFAPGTTEEQKQCLYDYGIPCHQCHATGVIDYDYEQRKESARAFRQHLMVKELTMRKLAELTGISITTISDMCSGVEEPDFAIFDMPVVQEGENNELD